MSEAARANGFNGDALCTLHGAGGRRCLDLAEEVTTPWWLRTLIAFDALLQVMWRYGQPGVTMSSRIGTAAAHGHAWGLAGSWLLDKTPWLGFGPGHCRDAICNDILRARAAIVELTDPVVVKYYADKS